MKQILFFIAGLLVLMSCSKEDIQEIENTPDCAISYIENYIEKYNIPYCDVKYNKNNIDLHLRLLQFDRYYFNENNTYKVNLIKKQLEETLNISLKYEECRKYTTLTSITGETGKVEYHHRFSCKIYGDEIIIFTSPDNEYGFITLRVFCESKHQHLHNKLK
jgi:hypothetical protein